ncbi:AAA family ATPase [uncultured Methanobrevibacter sp.]|uniref:AAA family ATPase n=1 Tax=uncultured Methanobrevibacter sp. TaxID=253161 RepID=UPI0025D05308|nr:AAA family ATPase [uncultured Methanobrevibacter sp.]
MGYVGQTAIKTQDKIKEAMGGILFIDEAYALSSKGENDFGEEAIDTILKAMEDNRDDFIVIVAGYPQLMDDFLHSNPGLESRFNKHLFFEDYNPQELFDIFVSMEEESNLKLDKKAESFLKGHFEDVYKCRGDNFANGRYVRNIFEKVLSNQADRLVNIEDISDDDLNTLIIEDFDDCL